MKKICFSIVCIVMMGAFTAFGQTAVNGSTDSEIAAEQETATAPVKNDVSPVQPSQEDTAGLSENDASADNNSSAETASDTTPEETLAEAAANADTDAPKSVNSPAANITEGDDSSDMKTVISTGESGSKTQERKDILQPVEMNEPTKRTKRRSLSMHSGLTMGALGANNVVSFSDFFKPELVIDFNKLSQKTIKSGLHASALFNFDWFFQFTVLGEHTVKLSTTVNADGWMNVSKSLLDLVAKGNAANAQGETIKGVLNAKLNVFADTGVMYQLKKPNYGFSARLAYFVPLAYMENPQATFTLSPKTNDDAIEGLNVKAEGTMNIYGYMPALAAERGLSGTELLKNGGLDLSLAGSYSPTKWVAVTGGINYLPIMVVQMNTGIRSHFEYEGTLDNLLETKKDKNKEIFTPNMDVDPLSADLPQKKIMRPLKINIGADFRPLQNDYLILSPFLAFPVINAKPYYADGGLKIESRFAKVLGVYFDTGCIERMWRHELCFFIDSRWFTLNLAASVASHDFRRTFTTLSGLGVKLGVGIGF